ncbi:hypothetical protein M0R45_006290 [Rubus argutus]|uniref:Uncharacterized protein n=1 Tax=Rubus argutus TaxID=59490 RepID=A0AAW1YQ40_RUBAR
MARSGVAADVIDVERRPARVMMMQAAMGTTSTAWREHGLVAMGSGWVHFNSDSREGSWRRFQRYGAMVAVVMGVANWVMVL